MDTQNEVMKQIRRITNVPGVIGYECPFSALEGFISTMYFTVTQNSKEMHTRLLAHDNLIDDVEVNIEGIKQRIKQL